MSKDFWKGETYTIVKAIKAAGNQPGLVQQWKDGIEQWAKVNQTPEAKAVQAWLPLWQVRPFYTASELAPIWPALAIQIGHTVHWPKVLKSAMRLGFELQYAGAEDFDWHGQRYYIVERPHYWRRVVEAANWPQIDQAFLGTVS